MVSFLHNVSKGKSMDNHKKGILLLNMGGPEKQQDVAPFLFNLFSDREIIQLGPSWLQRPLAWWIARRRAGKSRKAYALIGGGSPLKRLTLQQAACLQDALPAEEKSFVTVAMRYWHPRTEEAVALMLSHGVREILAISLYPHFSRATTGSSIAELKRVMNLSCPEVPLRIVDRWPDHPLYIKALVENIHQGLEHFSGENVQIVYSAHSLPVSFINAGDPYVEHLLRTVRAIEKRTGLTGRLCYQSRSGPVEWLTPSTPSMIKSLAEEGCRNILMVPISFVSDHIETLYEIDILYKQQAEELGIRLRSSASLNTHPTFIACLRDLALYTRDAG